MGFCCQVDPPAGDSEPKTQNLRRFEHDFFPNAPQKRSRFKVGVHGSRRRREVVAFVDASVRNRSQASAERRTCVGHAGDENRCETQNCRHFLSFVLQKCQPSQGSGGSWSRNAELSSLLDSSPGGPGRETQNCRHFWTRLRSQDVSKVSTVTGIGGVVVTKRRTAVTLLLERGEER